MSELHTYVCYLNNFCLDGDNIVSVLCGQQLVNEVLGLCYVACAKRLNVE